MSDKKCCSLSHVDGDAMAENRLTVVDDDDLEGARSANASFKLGESAVGKSSLILRLVFGEFQDSSVSTIGAAFIAHTIQATDGHDVHFDLWDTAGQEKYRALAPMYYRGAQAAIIVFDVTCKRTFAEAKTWINMVRHDVTGVRFALVGNKCDLRGRKVRERDAQEFAEDEDLMYYETSAKTGKGVQELFRAIADRLEADA